MKKLLTLFFLFSLSFAACAQVPNLFNYQAVARNAQGQALANQNIKVRLTHLIKFSDNTSVNHYMEIRSVTTNALGLFNVQIGGPGALSSSGSLQLGSWSDPSVTHWLKVELDIANTNSFVDMGTQQLVSVPFAFSAQEAESAKRVTKPFIGFRAQLGTSVTWTGNSIKDMIYDVKAYDSSVVYNATTGEFIVPENGMYVLHCMTTVYQCPAANTFSIRFVSSTRGPLMNTNFGGPIHTFAANNSDSYQHSMTVYLSAGERIKVSYMPSSKTSDVIFNYHSGNFFEAYKLN